MTSSLILVLIGDLTTKQEILSIEKHYISLRSLLLCFWRKPSFRPFAVIKLLDQLNFISNMAPHNMLNIISTTNAYWKQVWLYWAISVPVCGVL